LAPVLPKFEISIKNNVRLQGEYMTLNFKTFIDSFLHMPRCVIGYAVIDNLDKRQRIFFTTFMPKAKTAIVLGHHITKKSEWSWYATNNGSERCDADDHAADLCRLIKEKFEMQGFSTNIVPYPKESGLQFRFVAQSAGLGKIGKSAFLLHPEWGPWIHLRVIATEASFEISSYSPYLNLVCTECGKCIEACPAKAITDGSFDGLKCRSYRKSKGEYTPFGPKRELRYCEICARVCPIGNEPQN
jgi:epoxyqueuosine reductase